MEAFAIVFLILLIFLLSCDSALLQTIKDRVVGPPQEVSPFSAEDNYEILPDPMSDVDRKETFLGSREATTTWEPSTADFQKLGADKIYKSYAEDLKANVDRAIVESHREYTADTDFLATTGASHASARDDFMPAVKFHGLPRSAHYANPASERTSRTSQSETPETVEDISEHNTTGYKL